jgi:hypothetical protein
MAHVDPQCFCRADEETLEHPFFECRVARIVTAWIFVAGCDPAASKFTVDELHFGFMAECRRKIPLVILWMLHTMKHIIWVACCDFQFRGKTPRRIGMSQKTYCLNQACPLSSWSEIQVTSSRCSEKEWLASGLLGHFAGKKLVFSF